MPINPVTMNVPTVPVAETNKTPITSYEAQQNFATTLKNAIADVNSKQIESDVMTGKLINGGNVELHDVMITAQKASVTLNATIEVRNKVVEAYQEIMRMQV